MTKMKIFYRRLDKLLTLCMAEYGIPALRISLGVIFLWFGVLKFFPGSSPAEDLAIRTTHILTFGLIPDSISIILLAAWESIIGVGLILGVALRGILLLLFVQMLGTVSPLFIFPGETFTQFPFVPTLEGQYIIKNIVIVSAALVVGSTVRGGGVISEPQPYREARRKVPSTHILGS